MNKQTYRKVKNTTGILLAALSVVTLPRPELFNSELLRNEQVLWIGKPENSGIFGREDLFFFRSVFFG